MTNIGRNHIPSNMYLTVEHKIVNLNNDESTLRMTSMKTKPLIKHQHHNVYIKAKTYLSRAANCWTVQELTLSISFSLSRVKILTLDHPDATPC
jgi:hypothetical protein